MSYEEESDLYAQIYELEDQVSYLEDQVRRLEDHADQQEAKIQDFEELVKLGLHVIVGTPQEAMNQGDVDVFYEKLHRVLVLPVLNS